MKNKNTGLSVGLKNSDYGSSIIYETESGNVKNNFHLLSAFELYILLFTDVKYTVSPFIIHLTIFFVVPLFKIVSSYYFIF